MKCVYCHAQFQRNLALAEIVAWQRLSPKCLCPRCHQLFQLNHQQPKCLGCDKSSTAKFCTDCLSWQKRYPEMDFRHEALYKYEQHMHEWFEQYKFKGDLLLAQTFSSELATYFQKWRGWLVIPIPLSAKRARSRGFNQVEMLLKYSDIAYSALLTKGRHQQSQTSKSREERLATKQSFKLAKGAVPLIRQQKIVLVDDVYTTGRTMFHARECLLEARPKKIVSFTLAR